MSYYREQVPILIESIKKTIAECYKVIDEEIDQTMSEDKRHSVLKGKRMAVDDVKHYAKEIDTLQNELDGILEETDEEKKVSASKKHVRIQ
jgi:protein-arginine kinase activator protein McsA